MAPDSKHPLELVPAAMLAAARKLGVEGVFLRLVAAELPEKWISPLEIRDADGHVVVTTLHSCGPLCGGSPGRCLAALKVEEIVARKKGRPHVTDSLRITGDKMEIHLSAME